MGSLFRLSFALALLCTGEAALANAERHPGGSVDQLSCEMRKDDKRWLRRALGNWEIARRRLLKAHGHPFPSILTYDSRCSYTIATRVRWRAAQHHGEVVLPNGARIPPGPNAFNAAAGARNFVVFSLPSIWRPVAPESEVPLELFLEGILLHELAHAYQAAVTPSLSFPALHARHSLPHSVNDDSIQETFKANPAYVRDYEAERDLLFRASSAPTETEARALACDALEKMRQRRARYFRGANAIWSEVDELALTTEGVSEWLSYSWLTRVRGLSQSVVLPRFRGRYWSQEHGLALFLLIDRLLPGWQKLLFKREPLTAEPLLARTCGTQP